MFTKRSLTHKLSTPLLALLAALILVGTRPIVVHGAMVAMPDRPVSSVQGPALLSSVSPVRPVSVYGARLEAMDELADGFYARPEADLLQQRADDANTARWVAMGEFYARQAASATSLQQRANDANTARWTAIAKFYAGQAASATSLQTNSAADDQAPAAVSYAWFMREHSAPAAVRYGPPGR